MTQTGKTDQHDLRLTIAASPVERAAGETTMRADLKEGLRLIALEELIADCAADIPHDKIRTVTPPPTKQAVIWKCKPNCRRCRIDAVLASRIAASAAARKD